MAMAAVMTAEAAKRTIGDVKTLQAVATEVNAGADTQGMTIVLTADIDLADVEWVPIGTTAHPFMGTFDGKGHTLSNLKVDVPCETTGGVAGLFGQVGEGGIVRDVHVRGGQVAVKSNPYGATCFLGGIAGINLGTIVGCSNTALVSGYAWSARIGGITGENNTGGRIQNCYNLGEVYTSKSDNFIGGIVGNNSGLVQNCFMRSEVKRVVNKRLKSEPYPVCGNSEGGVCTGCFYANGATTHTTRPISIDNGADNSATIKVNDGLAANVLLSGRTLLADGDWTTLCLPFGIDEGAVAGYSPIAGAEVMTLESTSFDGSTLKMDFKHVASMEAGKPYIVRWKQAMEGDIPNPVFLNVTVSDTIADVVTTYVDFYGWPSQFDVSWADPLVLYMGTDNKLYYPSQPVTFGACRAYFILKGIDPGLIDPKAAKKSVTAR